MFGLRELFATRSAGWSPTVGKNRLVGDVIGGVGKISHGGGDMPTAIRTAISREVRARARRTKGRASVSELLDTSISSHRWLAGGWVSPPVACSRKGRCKPSPAGHATFVAGLVLSQAPACVVEARSLLSDDFGQATRGMPRRRSPEIGKTRPDVLNLSFTCYTEDGQAPLALATAIDRLDSEHRRGRRGRQPWRPQARR